MKSNAQILYDGLCWIRNCLLDIKAREPMCMIVETNDKELDNCKCRNDLVVDGPSLSGGWVNSTSDCQQCADGDLCAKFKIWEKETPRAYMMMGLSDSCSDNDGFGDIDFAFYSIIRNDAAVPYWIVYIYENGNNLGWVVYDRQEVPKCRDFEIRREGNVVEYYIDGNLVRSTTDSTNGATLCMDNSIHGNLTTGQPCITNQSVCQIVGGDNGGEGEGGGPTLPPAGRKLVSDNFQDQANVPFNLQVRNQSNAAVNWQAQVANVPYATIPNLVPGNYTLTTTNNGDGTFTHLFTGTQPLGAFQNIVITGGVTSPSGNQSGLTLYCEAA